MKRVVYKAGLYRLSDRLVVRLENVRHVIDGVMMMEDFHRIQLSLDEMENLRCVLECDACAEAQRIMESIRTLTGCKRDKDAIEKIKQWQAERQAAHAG